MDIQDTKTKDGTMYTAVLSADDLAAVEAGSTLHVVDPETKLVFEVKRSTVVYRLEVGVNFGAVLAQALAGHLTPDGGATSKMTLPNDAGTLYITTIATGQKGTSGKTFAATDAELLL